MNESNLYDAVEALTPGTIFRVSSTAPWMKTTDGLLSLLSAGAVSFGEFPMPRWWKDVRGEEIYVIYDPEQD